MKKNFIIMYALLAVCYATQAQVGLQYFKNTYVGIGTDQPRADLHVRNTNPIVQIEGDQNAQLYIWGTSPSIKMSGNNPQNVNPTIDMRGVDPQITLDATGLSYYPKISMSSLSGSGQVTTAGYGMAGGGINFLYGSQYGNQLGITAVGPTSYTEDPGHPVHTFIAPVSSTANILEVKKVLVQNVSFVNLMMMDKDGNLGINTPVATAKLHSKGTVRFEDLPYGEGAQVVIDTDGNLKRYVPPAGKLVVSNSSIDAAALQGMLDAYASQIRGLQQQLNELKAQYALCCDAKAATAPETGAYHDAADQPALFQCFPNPSNGRTTIGYYLPAAMKDAHITITDEAGRVLHHFSELKPGRNEVVFEPHNLVSGHYLYSLTIGGKVFDTKKMVLLID